MSFFGDWVVLGIVFDVASGNFPHAGCFVARGNFPHTVCFPVYRYAVDGVIVISNSCSRSSIDISHLCTQLVDVQQSADTSWTWRRAQITRGRGAERR